MTLKELFTLHELHINPEKDTIKTFEFMNMFGIGVVLHPDEELRKIQEQTEELKIQYAMEWIFKNSKL